jgi:hypothetical protein
MIDRLLLGIGAMKAGTTWLYANLSAHPEIFFSREKEIHFFSHINKKYELNNRLRIRHLNNAMRQLESEQNIVQARQALAWYYSYLSPEITDSWYFNLFREWSGQAYCADFSNTYAFLDEEGWSAVRRICENVKILYVLRDPAQRLWSHIKFHARFAGEQHDFATWSEERFRSYIEANDHLMLPGRYAFTVEMLRKMLNPTEYLLLYLDEFATQPEQALQKIESFLQIAHLDRDTKALAGRVNATEPTPVPEPLLAVVRGGIAEELGALEAVGVEVPKSWRETAFN